MKTKRCKVCKTEFIPVKPMQSVCSTACALSMVSLKKAKRERQETKLKLEKLKTRSQWIAETQVVFNKYIRLRDAGKPCICCGQPMGDNIPGGAVDAGHYRSRGSAPHLRFDERNVHAQKKQCNRYGAGRAVDYRLGLIERIGLEAVEALESDQCTRDHSIEALKAIKEVYKAKCKELERLNG